MLQNNFRIFMFIQKKNKKKAITYFVEEKVDIRVNF